MSVQSTRELKQVSRRLKRAGDGRIQRRAGRKLVTASKPVNRQIQAAVRAVEVGSSKGGTAPPDRSTNLRGRIAAAVDSAARAGGVVIFVRGFMIGRNGSKLAQYVDTEDEPRWRHPTFGRRNGPNDWQTNVGQPYFYVTIRAAEDDFADAVLDVLEEIAREICA